MGGLNLLNSRFDYPQMTWTNRPSRGTVGDIIIVTDIGPSDEIFTWTGSRWAPMNGCMVLSQTSAQVVLTGTTSMTQVALITVPGGLMSANGMLEIYHSYSFTSSANNKTFSSKIGGSSGTPFLSRNETSNTSNQPIHLIRNANSVSSQVMMSSGSSVGLGTSSTAHVTSAVNTGADFDLYFGLQLANSGETITLHTLRVIYRE